MELRHRHRPDRDGAADRRGTTGNIYSAISGMLLPQQQQYIQQGWEQAQGLLGGWAGQGPASAQQVGLQNAQSMMTPYTLCW